MEVSSSLTAFLQRLSATLLPLVDGFLQSLSDDPLLRGLQFGLFSGAALLVFLVFFTTRDILHRSRSLFTQIAAIFLVSALPVVGFLLYLLLRPAERLEEREMQENLRKILVLLEKKNASPGKLSFAPSRLPVLSLRKKFPSLLEEKKVSPDSPSLVSV